MMVASHDTLPTSSVCALRYCYFFLSNRVRPQIRHSFLFFPKRGNVFDRVRVYVVFCTAFPSGGATEALVFLW